MNHANLVPRAFHESCMKIIKTFESKLPKNRLALKKKSPPRFQLIKIKKKNTFELKRTLLLSSLKKYTLGRWGFFTLSKSTSLYDLNLILNYRMYVVIWLFLAKRAAYKFVAPCISWIAQRRRNSSWLYFYLLGFRIQCDVKAHFQHDFKFCGALSCFVHERLMSLFIVCQTMFTIGESRSISQACNWKTTVSTRQRSI